MSVEAAKLIVEAALFSAGRTLSEQELQAVLPAGVVLANVLLELARDHADRGVSIVKVSGGWALRTRPESSDLATMLAEGPARLTRAALETMAVIACFQPVTRTEIERVRGVQLSPGVMDQLLAAGYVRPGPRRETVGRPLTWMATEEFLEVYDLNAVEDLATFRRMREQNLLTLPNLKSLIVPGLPGEEDDGGR